MTPPLYQVANWHETYENYKSANLVHCSWFANPTGLDGLEYASCVNPPGERGLACFGLFQSILKLVGNQKKPRLGYLTHDGSKDGRRYTVEELSLVLRQSPDLVESILKRLVEIGCMVVADPAKTTPNPNETASSPVGTASSPLGTASSPVGTASSPDEPRMESRRDSVKKEGMKEGMKEGREGSGSLQNHSSQIVADPIQHTEAKQLLAKLSLDVFNTPLRENQWSQKWDFALSQALPMMREDWAVIDRFYRLPSTHQIFAVTRKRHSMGALIENLMDEPTKIRSAWAAIGRNGASPKAKPSEPERVPPAWVSVMRKKYGADISVPTYKKDIAPSVCAELEAFVANEAKTA